ncbi:MAG: Fic family protein, partial [Tunicatimonas sp.]
RDDWAEVRNYVEAMNVSIASLKHLPISNRLIKQTHRILLSGVRGKHKLPGEYRRSQNWIGATLKDAVFIPPHHAELAELMSDLEKFVHEDAFNVPHLIKIAIIHYQFETIHPFLDGNGRLGRLLIMLYLVSHNILSRPTLYLSDFFEKHRTHYYDNLMAVRLKNDLTQWIKFFLAGITETAQSSIGVFQKILALKQKIDTTVLPQLGSKERIANGFTLLNHLYRSPIIDAKEVSQVLNVAASTANRLIKDLVTLKVLHELTGYRRNRKFIFQEYFSIFQ